MTVDDRTRLNLHRKLEAVLGPEEANALMAHLPPVTWQDVATTKDLATLETSIGSEIDVFRAEMRAEFADVRAEMRAEFADVRAEMRAEFADVRGEMRAEFADVRGEMRAGFAEVRAETHRSIVEQTRWFVGCNFALAALVLTVARLIL